MKQLKTETTDDLKWELHGLTLEEALHKIKKWIQEYGGNVTLDIGEETESYSYSDKEYAYVKLQWKREETDEEYLARIDNETQARLVREDRERRQYEELKKKFGEIE